MLKKSSPNADPTSGQSPPCPAFTETGNTKQFVSMGVTQRLRSVSTSQASG